jgi:hypothetical protein
MMASREENSLTSSYSWPKFCSPTGEKGNVFAIDAME